MTIFSRKYVPALGLTFKAAASRRLFWQHQSFLVHTSTSETHFSDKQPLALSALTASIEEAHEETSGAPQNILAWSPQGLWCSLCWPVLLPCSLNRAAVEEQACGSPRLLAAPASYLKVCKKGRAWAPPLQTYRVRNWVILKPAWGWQPPGYLESSWDWFPVAWLSWPPVYQQGPRVDLAAVTPPQVWSTLFPGP